MGIEEITVKNELIEFENRLKIYIQKSIEKGIDNALKTIDEKHKINAKILHDRRLKNTKILLSNYINFINCCERAVYSEEQLQDEPIDDIINEIAGYDNEFTIVSSIKRSIARTRIMVEQMKRMIDFYIYNLNKTGNQKLIRRVKILKMLYLQQQPVEVEIIAKKLNCSKATVYNEDEEIVKDLSIYIFLIDGLNLNNFK